MEGSIIGRGVAMVAVTYLALPLASWLITILRASALRFVGPRTTTDNVVGRPVPLLFLVPAHNEEKVIARCVRSLLAQDYPAAERSVVVIADNCRDGTAAVARGLGAKCLVRVDPDRPGKPQAIAWGLEQLGDLRRWEACVIVDADSEVPSNFAAKVSGHQPLRDRLLQSYNTILNPRQSWLTRLAAVLGRARYEVEFPLRRQAGLNCPLTGNGMCLGTDLLERDGWKAFSLTENWEVYADYTMRGVEIVLANDAHIYSLETDSMSASRTRRSRWARGRMQVLKKYWIDILRSSQISWHQKLDLLSDLSGLPPTTHALVAGVLSVLFLILFDAPANRWYAAIALLTLLPLASSSAIALAKDPEPARAAGALLLLPWYALWRGWVLLESLILDKGSVWKKTERD